MGEHKRLNIKNRRLYYSDEVTDFQDLYLDKISVYKRQRRNNSICNVVYKAPLSQKNLFHISFDKVYGYIEKYGIQGGYIDLSLIHLGREHEQIFEIIAV